MLPQPLVGKAHEFPRSRLVLPAEPLSQPPDRVPVPSPVCWANLSEVEVVRPPRHHPVQASYDFLSFQPPVSVVRLLADPAADALNARPARPGADVPAPVRRTIVPADAVPKELDRLLGASEASGLLRVDRQLQPLHEPVDHRQHLRRRGLPEHTEVVRVVHDLRAEAPGMTQRLPAKDETAACRCCSTAARSGLLAASPFSPSAPGSCGKCRRPRPPLPPASPATP